jgi:hypothetical protein
MFVQTAFPQPKTIFSGVPAVKISEGGIERLSKKLSGEKATNLACVISEIGGKFY